MTPIEIEAERVSRMSFTQFAAAGIAVRIESSIVPTFIYNELWFVSDRVIAEEIKSGNPRAVVYGPGELQKIAIASPKKDALMMIHEAKKAFGGRVIEIKSKE